MGTAQEIIVAVDFQQHTQKLVDFAIDLANRLNGKLTIIHVLNIVIPYTDYSPESSKNFDEKLLAHVENKMEVLVEQSQISFPACKGVVLRGEVIESIVDFTREARADLLVMGTHGAKGIEKILLGSVAERVLKRASCPVLMFNPFKERVVKS